MRIQEVGWSRFSILRSFLMLLRRQEAVLTKSFSNV